MTTSEAIKIYATYFATLTVAFPRAMILPRSYFGGLKTFRVTVESFNNICEIEFCARLEFATFRCTKATAAGIARHGYEVRHVEGDKYMAARTRVGARFVEDSEYFAA